MNTTKSNPAPQPRRQGGNLSRRDFVRMAAGGAAFLSTSALSYSRIVGANDRIRIGLLGCGSRSHGHRHLMQMCQQDGNIALHSVCDLWTTARERAAADGKKRMGDDAKMYKYSEELLADKDLDAVMIATPDHQHAQNLMEVVRAGKDCYCEKPMANRIEDAKLALDVVKQSTQVVQMGSQWLSDPYQHAVRDIVRSGKLGRITRIEQNWHCDGPRWHIPKRRDLQAIREEDTDWHRWLGGRAYRPFDPNVYFEFRMYREFSGGIPEQLYSHAIGLTHFYLDTYIPSDTVANGGVFAWHDGRENPDTFACVSAFKEKEVLHSYSMCFGSDYGENTIIRGTEGTLYANGGEGSPQWWYLPATFCGWGSNIVFDRRAQGTPKPELVTIPGHDEIPPTAQNDDLKYHMTNWIDCMRSRKTPNGSIESGYAHSVAVVMANRSYQEERKVYWDRTKQDITVKAAV